MQQQRQIDAGVNADFIAQVDQVFSADIARSARRKRATAKAAQGRVEASGAGLVGGQHVAQTEAASVVEMQGQIRRRNPLQDPPHQPIDLPRIGHAGGVGQGNALDPELLIGVDDLQHAVLIDLAFERATEGRGDAAVEPHRRARERIATISPNAANEASQRMRMFARLWVWLADITRFSSSALEASARCAPLRLGINAT